MSSHEFVNLTPHHVSLVSHNGRSILELPPTGIVARVATSTRPVIITEEGASIVEIAYGGTMFLPPPREGTLFVVSQIVRLACPRRHDLVSPHSKVREDGRVVACRALVRNPPIEQG